MQMLGALRAAAEAGEKIERLDPWSRDEDFDILHVWGLEPAHAMNVHWAKKAGKQVVMTALLPYLTARSQFRWYLSLRLRKLAFAAGFRGWGPQRSALLEKIDRLVVVNQLQAETAVQVFGFPAKRIAVIPNIVENHFFANQGEQYHGEVSVLCTGNICRRKNQLMLAHACRLAGLSLLLIGSVLTGEEDYADEIQQVIKGDLRMRWIKGVAHDSDELLQAYRNAAVFALVSFEETQPQSLLEAKAVGCRLVIANRAYARQEYYTNAILVEPDSIASIAGGLVRAAKEGRPGPDPAMQKTCSRAAVGQAYVTLYHSLKSSSDNGPLRQGSGSGVKSNSEVSQS